MEVMATRAAQGQKLGTVEHPALPQIFTVTDLPEFSNWGRDPRMLRLVENYSTFRLDCTSLYVQSPFLAMN